MQEGRAAVAVRDGSGCSAEGRGPQTPSDTHVPCVHNGPPDNRGSQSSSATTSHCAQYKPGSKVRIIGLKKNVYNGKEGVLGKWDPDTNRWEFTSGSTSIKVKEANVECIRRTPKTVLASWFFDAADKFHYFDMGSNDYVFHRLYDMAADTTDGVNMLFEQSCSCEEMFDTLYQDCLK